MPGGLGNSTQKFGLLPAAHTDGVFAILGEEMGPVGSLLVLGLLPCWSGGAADGDARP